MAAKNGATRTMNSTGKMVLPSLKEMEPRNGIVMACSIVRMDQPLNKGVDLKSGISTANSTDLMVLP
jgi:hypothetical protein